MRTTSDGSLRCQPDAARGNALACEHPIDGKQATWYCAAMNLVLLVIVLLLLFGGGGFYFGGPAIGGGGVGLILVICLIVFLMGGFRAKS